MIKYENIYKELEIPYEPLPDNYTPDKYGKELMKNIDYPQGVFYSTGIETGVRADTFIEYGTENTVVYNGYKKDWIN